MSARNSIDGKAMLLEAAHMSRRGSVFSASAKAAAEGARLVEPNPHAEIDEEAGLGADNEGAAAAAAPSGAHDERAPSAAGGAGMSVMPTVVEHRPGVGLSAPAAPAVEAAETKMAEMDDEAYPEELSSSMRFRGAMLRAADGPNLASPLDRSHGGGGFGAKGGSSRESVGSTSSGHGGNSILSMFKKASHAFSHHNAALSRGRHAPSVLTAEDRTTLGPARDPQLPARGKLTEEDEAMLSDSEADYDAFDNNSERRNKRLLSPNFRFFRWYTAYMLIALLAFVFYMPIRIAFFPRDRGVWSAVDLMWNVLFILDIVINLNTGFVDKFDGKVVYDRVAIFWRYAKGWLIFDALAAFPFTFVAGLRPQDAEGSHESAYLLSLPKMFRVYWLLTIVQENHRLHEGAFMAIRTLLSVVVTAHLCGCGWYMLATLLRKECEGIYFEGLPAGEQFISANGLEYDAASYIASECPWIYRNDYAALGVGRRFLGSVYWALTTLTTVGYGDISARTPAEQVYSMSVQIVGVSWYGYIVGTWASVLNSFDREDKEQRSKLREVVAFSKAAGLPPDIAKKVRQHFRFALYRQDNWITFNEQELVADMPAGLRTEVINHVHKSTIAQIPWLEGKDSAFVADIAIMLKPRLFMNGDVLYRRGSQPEEMFFIASGLVMLNYKRHRVGYLRAGQMAGLIGLVSCEKHKITAVVAQRDAHCHGLSRAHFMELMERYPREMQELVDAAKSLAQRIAATSVEAKRELLDNEILAALVSNASALLGPASGGDRWTELQAVTLGHGPDSATRSAMPSNFFLASQQGELSASRGSSGVGGRKASGSEADALSNASPSSSTSSVLPTNLPAGSLPRPAGGSGGGGGGEDVSAASGAAVIEEAVGRAVSEKLSAVEERIGAVMERLEGILDRRG